MLSTIDPATLDADTAEQIAGNSTPVPSHSPTHSARRSNRSSPSCAPETK